MVVVTPTDRSKSVRNCCVIEIFGGVFVLSRCYLDFSVSVGAFVIGLGHIQVQKRQRSLLVCNIRLKCSMESSGIKVINWYMYKVLLIGKSIEPVKLKSSTHSFKLPFYYAAIFFNISFSLCTYHLVLNAMLDFSCIIPSCDSPFLKPILLTSLSF